MVSRPPLYAASLLPPIFSVSSLAMDRPRPVEPLAVSTVKKRSKRRSACTRFRLWALFVKVTAPFGISLTTRSPSEYLAALLRMLSKIRRSAAVSSSRTTAVSASWISGVIPRADSAL